MPVVIFLDHGDAPTEFHLEGDKATHLSFWYRAFVLPDAHYSVYRGLARTGYALMVLAGAQAGLDTGRLAWRMRVGMTLVLGTVALFLIGQSSWALWAAVQGRI